MADVLHVAEIWTLVSMLLGWFFARAAACLREPPVTLADVLSVEQAGPDHRDAHSAHQPDQDALLRAVRIYDRI